MSELTKRLREYADIDASDGGNPDVIQATYEAAAALEDKDALICQLESVILRAHDDWDMGPVRESALSILSKATQSLQPW